LAKVKITMLVSLAGESFAVNAGDLYECDQAEAARMIAAGFAEPVASKPRDSRESKRPVSARKDDD
jgi:hypothetical protein